MPELSVTSFALLGLLAIQSWSAYELKEFMHTSALRSVWPRAASTIYREPRVLVEHGLATVRGETHRGPRRSVYTITDDGRRALRDWLDAPGVSRRVEDEGLVHVLFAENGTKAQLLAQIAAMRAAAERSVIDIGVEQIAKQGLRFPQRAHISVLVLRNGLEQRAAQLRWCTWAEAQVRTWPDDLRLTDEQLAELAHLYDSAWIRTFTDESSKR